MKTIYLGLGSNIGDRETALQEAINRLQAPNLEIRRVSSVFETSPMEMTAQPWFLNMVVEAETDLFPMQLLKKVAAIERDLGRKRLVLKGPRTIDIDILLYGNFIVDTEQLKIPHPRLAERRFVLEPLSELAPEMRHPISRKMLRELLANTAGQQIRKSSFRPRLPSVSDGVL
jgi:2-amino-4-hydroxy-6-hydroxymethyldihydropteridine diphosphokinase